MGNEFLIKIIPFFEGTASPKGYIAEPLIVNQRLNHLPS